MKQNHLKIQKRSKLFFAFLKESGQHSPILPVSSHCNIIILILKSFLYGITLLIIFFSVFQDFPQDAPFHRVRRDVGGPRPGSGDQQADRHQQSYGGPQRLRVEEII